MRNFVQNIAACMVWWKKLGFPKALHFKNKHDNILIQDLNRTQIRVGYKNQKAVKFFYFRFFCAQFSLSWFLLAV